MSFITTFEHATGNVLHDLKAGGKAVAHAAAWLKGHETQIDTDVEIAAGVAALIPGIGPLAPAIAKAGEMTLGATIDVIDKIEADLTKVNPGTLVPVTIQLDADAVAGLKAIKAAVQSQLPLIAAAAPAPAK